MQERIFRFGHSGITFLLTTYFGFWYFGGVIDKDTLSFFEKNYITTIIAAFISTPILGFIISSFGSVLLKSRGVKHKFCLPLEEFQNDYFELLNKHFPNDSNSTLDPENKKNLETISMNHQILFRQYAKEEVMKYTCRRMDVYWTHVNTITSIIVSLIFSLWLVHYTKETELDFQSMAKTIWIIPIGLYIIIGILLAVQNLKESNHFEKKFLINDEANRINKFASEEKMTEPNLNKDSNKL